MTADLSDILCRKACPMKKLPQITFIWGILTLIACGLAHLALTDIYHGAEDLTLEWRMVQIAGFITITFIGLALAALSRQLKRQRA
jgi:hypothetical protein